MIETLILIGFGLSLFYLIGIYNNLIEVREQVKKAMSNIDVLLKQRNEELPKLVEVCKQYMRYEENALTRVVEARQQVEKARSAGDMDLLSSAETVLRGSLGQLFALAENYPELKAEQSFQHLNERISSLQESISDRREFFNEQAMINNVKIEQFPDLLIVKLFAGKFTPVRLLRYKEQELKDPNLSALFRQTHA